MSTKLIEAIVIGGSAGALEALSVLLPALPVGCPFAVAIVVHLPPTRPSRLAEVLAGKTALPVKEVEDKEPVVSGTVYVGPPGYHLLIERGRTFALSADDLIHYSRPAIDVLFESAADAYGPAVAGLVLSGANQDGAEGLCQIQQAGGVAIVQAPATASSPMMPETAMRRVGPSARVVRLVDLGAFLARLVGAKTRGGKVLW
jgi:two-component system, chemotaxis family, protein-glutamate methylesterase/glutaminase